MKILIFGNTYRKDIREDVQHLLSLFQTLPIKVCIEKEYAHYLTQTLKVNLLKASIFEIPPKDAQLAFSIGGDGSLLRTAHLIGANETPILGINFGHLGFLTDISPEEINDIYTLFRTEQMHIEKRTLLDVEFEGADRLFNFSALNEVAVLKQDLASMISIETRIDHEHILTYQADGLIVATPTGSTAYNMSVNGPILTPDSANIILSPIAPHSLNMRPLVLPDHKIIEIKVHSRSKNFLVTVDGNSQLLDDTVTLRIKKSQHYVNILKTNSHSFYTTLKRKLLWGQDFRE